MAIFDRLKKSKEATEKTTQEALGTPEEAKKPAKAKATKAKAEKKEKGEKKATKAKKETTAKKSSVTPTSAKLGNLISRPVITEKSTMLAEQGTYVFFVDGSANKILVKQAIREVYGVTPTRVRTSIQKGKVVRWGRVSGKRTDLKKAFVTLKKGDTIDLAA